MHGYRPPTTVGPTIGSVGERMFAFTMNRTAGVLGERFVNITEYNNGWNKNQSIAGRTSGRAYSVIARNVGNAMYVLVHNPAETASNTPHSVSIYKFENNMWSTIIEAYVKPNEAGDSYVPIDLTNHDLAVDKDGNIYLGISYNLTPQVVKFDSSSKDFNLVATVSRNGTVVQTIAGLQSARSAYCMLHIRMPTTICLRLHWTIRPKIGKPLFNSVLRQLTDSNSNSPKTEPPISHIMSMLRKSREKLSHQPRYISINWQLRNNFSTNLS